MVGVANERLILCDVGPPGDSEFVRNNRQRPRDINFLAWEAGLGKQGLGLAGLGWGYMAMRICIGRFCDYLHWDLVSPRAMALGMAWFNT
jgi:hypothetical protein